MPKQKTHKGLSKRAKVTAKGKVKVRKSFSGHLMSSKTAKRRRNLRRSAIVDASSVKRVKTLLGKN